MRLYLDDLREPPQGFTLVRDIAAAKLALESGEVTDASLDHDLGSCAECMGGKSIEEWMDDHHNQAMPNCEHIGTGYNLVCWMEETGHWPTDTIRVHSSNPVGRMRMLQAIQKHLDALALQAQNSGHNA